jgi:hypothetical protein
MPRCGNVPESIGGKMEQAVTTGSIYEFSKVAPFLTHPLVLIGFVVLLFFGLIKALLKAKIVPVLDPNAGGDVVKLFLRYGFVVALLIIGLGFGIEGWKLYLQRTDASAAATQIKRALTPIDNAKVSFQMTIPLEDSAASTYRTRLQTEFQRVVVDYKEKGVPFSAANAAMGTELTKKLKIGLLTGVPGENGTLLPGSFTILHGSTLMPGGNGELPIKSLVQNCSVYLTFYKKAIQPSLYKSIFPATNPPPDWSFGVTASTTEESLSLEYFVGTTWIKAVARGLPADAEHYLAKSENITSLEDLAGAQVFVHLNPMDEALAAEFAEARSRIKKQIILNEVSVYLGHGKTLKIPINPEKRIATENGGDVFMYTIPLDFK